MLDKNVAEMESAVGWLLDQLGYDRTTQHFTRTPQRVARMLSEYAKNGSADRVRELLGVTFIEPGAVSSLVLEGPVDYVSMCAHHMLPVTGTAWIGYLPAKAVCGLSKLARVVDHYAHQLGVQEVITQQIADALVEHLEPMGAMVVVRAQHGCMSTRGVRQPQAFTTTSAVRGAFKESAAARNEFLQLMQTKG
jgi:GTP cyclohydrolase I